MSLVECPICFENVYNRQTIVCSFCSKELCLECFRELLFNRYENCSFCRTRWHYDLRNPTKTTCNSFTQTSCEDITHSLHRTTITTNTALVHQPLEQTLVIRYPGNNNHTSHIQETANLGSASSTAAIAPVSDNDLAATPLSQQYPSAPTIVDYTNNNNNNNSSSMRTIYNGSTATSSAAPVALSAPDVSLVARQQYSPAVATIIITNTNNNTVRGGGRSNKKMKKRVLRVLGTMCLALSSIFL